jgi:hypothetical protein
VGSRRIASAPPKLFQLPAQRRPVCAIRGAFARYLVIKRSADSVEIISSGGLDGFTRCHRILGLRGKPTDYFDQQFRCAQFSQPELNPFGIRLIVKFLSAVQKAPKSRRTRFSEGTSMYPEVKIVRLSAFS